MKITNCRSCQSNSLKSLYSLGTQYLTGIFPKNKSEKVPKGELKLIRCKRCTLLQLQNNYFVSI